MDILEIAKENGFFNDVLKHLKEYILEEVNGQWCYLRSDGSGRDFYEPIPIQYVTEDEQEHIIENLIEGNFDLDDYDWEEYEIDDVEDFVQEELFDELLDELLD